MGLQRFPLNDFRGGLNLRDAAESLEPNEAQALLNVTLTDLVGALAQRRGKVRFDSAGFPAAKFADNMRPWIAANVIVLSIDGSIYTCTAAGVLTLRFAGTAGTVWAFEQATDSTNTNFLWMMNGTDTPKKMSVALAVADWANAPPNGSMLKMWRNRMCVSGVAASPQRLFFSNIGDPEAPAAAYGTQWNDIKTTDDDLDAITELNVLTDYLYTFKRGSVWKTTNSNPPWDSQRIGGPGCESRFQSAVIANHGKLYYLSRLGIFSVTAENAIVQESDSVNPIWQAAVPRASFAYYSKARMMATPNNRILVSLPLDAATANNYVIELIPNMNFRRLGGRHYVILPAVVMHDFHVSAMCWFRPDVAGPDVVIAGASDVSRLHKLFSGTNDDGVAINGYWQSGWKSLLAEEPFERLRRVNVELEGRCIVELYRDFSGGPSFTKAVVSAQDPDPYWEGGPWEPGIWEPADGIQLVRVRPETRARYHSVRFSNSTLDKTFVIYAAEFALRGGKEH